MTEAEKKARDERWAARAAQARRELEEAAARGDPKAQHILDVLDDKPRRQLVDPKPRPPPPRPWTETDREEDA